MARDNLEDNELESLEDLISEANAEFEEDEIEEEDVDKDPNDSDDESNDEPNEEDGDSDTEDDEPNEEDVVTTPEFEEIIVNVNGVDVKINSKEEMMAFIKKGAEGFKSNEDSYKNEKDIITQGKLTAEDLKLLVDAKNGNPKALAKLAEQSKIDLYDINEDDAKSYTPEFNVKQDSDIDIVAKQIMSDAELHKNFVTLSNSLPSSFIDKVTSNAKDLATFGQHVKSGLAQQIIPDAIKLTYQGYDFAQAYVMVGEQLVTKQKSENTNMPKEEPKQRVVSDREKQLRQKAKETSSPRVKTTSDLSEDDIWNMSKEEFDEYTAKGN